MRLFVILSVCIAGVYCESLSQAEKQAVLDAHNKFRRTTAKGETKDKNGKVQPSAADMSELEWDETLSESSDQWVETCPMPGPHGHEEQTKYGENIAWGAPVAKYPMERLVELWYEEITVKPGKMFGDVSSFQLFMTNKGIGHYTQMMNAKAFKLGCAKKVCPKPGKDEPTINTLVCRYLIGGNIIGDPIYAKGPTASQCHENQTPKDGLCSGAPFNCDKSKMSAIDLDDCDWYTGDDPAAVEYGGCSDGYIMGLCPIHCGLCG